MVESLQADLERAQNQIIELGALLQFAQQKGAIYERLWEEQIKTHEACASKLVRTMERLDRAREAMRPGRN
jgi:cob(I)alamin adenosyltransferase